MRKLIIFFLGVFIFMGFVTFGEDTFPAEKVADIQEIKLKANNCISFSTYVQKDFQDLKKHDWWSTLHPLINLKKFTLTTIASSTLGDAYQSANLCDGKAETAWVEGVKGSGIGEWVKININAEVESVTSTPFSILEIGVIPGYAKTKKTWLENNRVKGLTIVIHSPQPSAPPENEWVIYHLDLKDENILQVFDLPYKKMSVSVGHVKRKEIWIKITDIYKGSKYDDTCISELVIMGAFSS